MSTNLASFTDVLGEDEIADSQGSQPISLPSSDESRCQFERRDQMAVLEVPRPIRGVGQRGEFRSVEEIDPKYRDVFTYPFFNVIQSRVLDDALYSDKSMVVCAPTGSGKTVVFEMAIVQLLMELENKNFNEDFKIIYMAPVKALCTERLTEWYSKFTRLGLMCIEVTGDTDVDFSQLKPYRIIITTPEKWDMLTRRWRDHKGLVETIKLFLIDEVHILNDETRGPVLEAVVSRMKTIESSAQSVHRIEQLQKQYQHCTDVNVTAKDAPRIRFVAVSATVNNPEDVAAWLGSKEKPAVYYKFDDECRPVKLKRVVEGYPCPEGTSIFKFDIILNYKLWPIIQKYHDGKPTLIFCNTRKSVALTAEALSRELTISFTPEQQARLNALASTIKTKKLQALVLSGVGCHHAGLLYEERINIEIAFRNRDLPILITTTTLAMGVNLPAHLVIIKNTQQYVKGAYQEYSISTILQMVGRAGRPQFDTEATAVIMTRLADKPRYQALVRGSEPLQSFLHKRLPENLNSEAALGTVTDVAQCVQWLRSTFLYVRAARDPKWYLGLPPNAPSHQISKKIEELCVTAMNGLASSGLITMDEASCIESTEAGRLMSVFYLDLQTMKQIIKIEGTETLERLLWIICESHELSDMHLRVDERRCLNALNRNNTATTIRFPMKGKISTRQMKLNCIIQAVLGCLHIPDPSLNQEAMKIMRIADRVCKCLVAYLTRPDLVTNKPKFYTAVLNSLILAKCVSARLWENSPYVSKQLKGIGPTFSTLLATAGKTNFMLLEESHPRDLERIMNKGAPAGNVIRKQVSLLPKYQLTMMPIDEKKVSVQLILLNKEHMAENLDNLTAGDRHKCYIVVGDSENHLSLLTSFKDRDFINTYDGTITHDITRKHNNEYKIFIHCISSDFVGLDVHEEYTFKNIEAEHSHRMPSIITLIEEPTKEKPSLKQTSITDVYKMRKRKCNENDMTQSKEKKKRETALIDKFRILKESFGYKSKKLMQDLHDSTQKSNKILIETTTSTGPFTNENQINVQAPSCSSRLCFETNKGPSDNALHPVINSNKDIYSPDINIEHMDDEDCIADECVDDILKEIEIEISKNQHDTNSTHHNTLTTYSPHYDIVNEKLQTQSSHLANINSMEQLSSHLSQTSDNYSLQPYLKMPEKNMKRRKNIKSNFAFIDTIENKLDSHEEEEIPKDNGFSETIKNHVEYFLLNTKAKRSQTDKVLKDLLEETDKKTSHKTYCDISSNKHYANAINDSEKIQSFTENETENINKYEIDDNINIMENNKLHLSDNSKQSSAQNYDLEDDFKDLPDCSISKTKKNNSLETDNTQNKKTVLNSNNVSNKFSNLNSIKNINIDKIIRKYSFSCDNKVSDLIDSNDSSQANCMQNETKNYIKDPKFNTDDRNMMKNNKLYLSGNSKHNHTQIYNLKDYSIPTVNTENCLEADNATIKYYLNSVDLSPKKETASNKSKNCVYEGNIKNVVNSLIKLSNTEPIDIDDTLGKYSFSSHRIANGDNNISMAEPNIDVTKSINVNSMGETTQKMQISDCESVNSGKNLVQKEHVSDKNDEYIFNCKDDLGKGYINKYSFSATKIDVSSKKTDDLEIQYIRKFKLNLDVTEIVSARRGNCKSNKVFEKQSDFNDSNISNNMNLNTEEKQLTYPCNKNKVLKIANITNKQDSVQNDSKIRRALVSPKRCNDKKLSPSEKQFKLTMKKDLKTQRSQIIQNNNTPRNEDNLKPNLKEVVENAKHCNLRCGDSNTEISLIKNDLQVENILRKYRNILKKNYRPHNTSITHTQILQDCSSKKLNKEPVRKRLFKISDIHNLDTPLPKNRIIDIVRTTRSAMGDDVLTRSDDTEIVKSQPYKQFPQLNKNIKQNNENVMIHVLRNTKSIQDEPFQEKEQVANDMVTPVQHNSDYTYEDDNHNYEDNYPCTLSFPLETTELVDIVEQSMLDPKTLLQSLSKYPDDEIIPPPQEFCDEDINYSPTTRAEHDVKSFYDLLDVDSEEANYDLPTKLDDTHLLTPSKEIETWTLSKEDELESLDFQPNPIRSFTITHVNSPGDNVCFSGESSRQAKLCNYKFTHKSKMRI